MKRFLVEIEVDEDQCLAQCNQHNEEVGTSPAVNIEEAIRLEFYWLYDSGIFIHRIVKEITDVHEDNMGV